MRSAAAFLLVAAGLLLGGCAFRVPTTEYSIRASARGGADDLNRAVAAIRESALRLGYTEDKRFVYFEFLAKQRSAHPVVPRTDAEKEMARRLGPDPFLALFNRPDGRGNLRLRLERDLKVPGAVHLFIYASKISPSRASAERARIRDLLAADRRLSGVTLHVERGSFRFDLTPPLND